MKDAALKNLDWEELVQRMAVLATSELARQKLQAMGPLPTAEQAEEQMQQVDECGMLVRSGLRPHMESLDLFATWFPRLERQAVLKPMELRDVRSFCIETIALFEALKPHTSPFLTGIRSHLLPAHEPLSAIDQVMVPSGEIRMDASETMFRLHQEKTGLSRQVQTLLDKTVKDHSIEHLLQEKYVTTREGRWVLPIKSGQQHYFEGIIHDSSQTKQTVFMEPQACVPLNNRLREIELEIEAEIERLLTELSHYLSRHTTEFKETKLALLEMDYKLAMGSLSVKVGARACPFTKDGEGAFHLENVRHPILVLNGIDVVANSVELNQKERVLLLSGPNAGGKTVLLKSVGLAAQMARAGLPICADAGSRLPFFKNILVGVGDAQSVDANLSTFAAHLKMLSAATELQGCDSLVLIDEICGSTDPEEGAALARSFILRYCENKVYAVVTSHLGALKTGWPEGTGLVNGSLEFDKAKGPTYRFLLGVPGQSLAIQTAKRVGVDIRIIERAYEFLSPEMKKYQLGIEEIEKLKTEVWRLQDTLLAERKELALEKKKYAEMQNELDRERDKILDKELRQAQKRLDEMIDATKAQDVFSRHSELQKIKYELPKVIKGESESSDMVFDSAENFAKSHPPGSAVFVPHLSREAVVQSSPNAKGDIVVLAGSMRLTVNWRSLQKPGRAHNPTKDLVRKSSLITTGIADTDMSLDVRGMTAEAALEKLELELDKASLQGCDRVKVVHGHGTEALKRAIRTHLSRSMYVKKWYAGTPETGGDGLTWVEIK